MLTSFDWLRQSGSGAELLTTLTALNSQTQLLDKGQLGAPHSALGGPCRRCWVYAPLPNQENCPFCRYILNKARNQGDTSRQAVVVWGYLNQLPRQMEAKTGFYTKQTLGQYIHDKGRFLLMLHRLNLKDWLQELMLYHGTELKGLLQVFPTMAAMTQMEMGGALAQIVQRETNYSMDKLRVQFYASPAQIRRFNTRDKRGKLTFEITEFMRLLEIAAVFRTMLYPAEQEALYKLLNLDDSGEVLFYWGRFLGQISQEAKDMLNAWRIRQWPKNQVELLYELVDYVEFS